MICNPCRLAADIQTELQADDEPKWTNTEPVEGNPAGALRFIAHSLHQLCKGNTHCDCQHRLVEPGKNVQSTNLS